MEHYGDLWNRGSLRYIRIHDISVISASWAFILNVILHVAGMETKVIEIKVNDYMRARYRSLSKTARKFNECYPTDRLTRSMIAALTCARSR